MRINYRMTLFDNLQFYKYLIPPFLLHDLSYYILHKVGFQ